MLAQRLRSVPLPNPVRQTVTHQNVQAKQKQIPLLQAKAVAAQAKQKQSPLLQQAKAVAAQAKQKQNPLLQALVTQQNVAI
jgi:hypothetical protein